jgi:mRNA interferase YafQ
MKYLVKPTSRFKKDLKTILKRGYNRDLLLKIIDTLAQGIPLDDKYRDHSLSGDYNGHRECHLQPDWLLIYFYNDDVLVLTLTRTGTHSDLFK